LVDENPGAINGNHSGNPQWYKDAVIYQLHVKSFLDTSGDGVGDFNGLTEKLDYLESLGITAIWLLPFYPSPQKDDGYDISDYFDINPAYGAMKDFNNFLREAHGRGMKVITELVLNHTSDRHEWFKRSRAAKPGSYWRDFYVWSDTNDRYKDARVIFKDFETSNWAWDPEAKAYYWHRFYFHQPDLNYENSEVHKMMLKVIDYWMELGVDGLRLDAAPYLYEQEGTDCENLPQTFEFLRKLRRHVDANFKDRMLLAEANQWLEDTSAYFGDGDICHMAFHFPLMPRMFMALRREDRFPVVDILEQTPKIPESAQWAIFLRNHDELTLEMVTEEERDFMLRTYAHDPAARINSGIRRRLAPLLQNSRRGIELMNVLLFSLPGTPVVYYGDEIGMGDNHFLGDRNGVRTPMQWSSDMNGGFSRATPQRLYLPVIIDPEYHYETVNVENEERSAASLLWWTRRLIATRRRYAAFSRGTLELVQSDNANVLTFIRRLEGEIILVAVNLSRFFQVVSMDLRAYAGYTPKDAFGVSRLPRITEAPYVLTMGFHDCFWLILQREKSADLLSTTYQLPVFSVKTSDWPEVLKELYEDLLKTEAFIPYLRQRTTAGLRCALINEIKIIDSIPVENLPFRAMIFFIEVRLITGEPDIVVLPLSAAPEDEVNRVIGNDKGLVMALLSGGVSGLVYDCAYHPSFEEALLRCISARNKLNGKAGAITGRASAQFRAAAKAGGDSQPNRALVKAGSHVTYFSYGAKMFFRLFRRIEEGVNPDVELHKKLSPNEDWQDGLPEFYGAINYRNRDGSVYEIGILTSFVRNTGSVWSLAVDEAVRFLEEVLTSRSKERTAPSSPARLFRIDGESKAEAETKAGPFAKTAAALSRAAARMHRALAALKEPDCAPEVFTELYQRSLYQSMRGLTRQTANSLRHFREPLSEEERTLLNRILENETGIIDAFAGIYAAKISGCRFRIHGNFHLGRIFIADTGLVVRDFEGDPFMVFSERRLKRSPLRDVASMVNSIHRAALYALQKQVLVQKKERHFLEPWADPWSAAMSNLFISGYLKEMESSCLLPDTSAETMLLLKLFLIERAIREIDSRLRESQKGVFIPLAALDKYLSHSES
jgi:maltose alpha-D-glucosyltransferase / alpha-amylase